MAKKKKGDDDTRSAAEIKASGDKLAMQSTLHDAEQIVSRLRRTLGMPRAIFPLAQGAMEMAVFENPANCPRCNSDDVDDQDQMDGGESEQTFHSHCNACNFEWVCVYGLKSVTTTE